MEESNKIKKALYEFDDSLQRTLKSSHAELRDNEANMSRQEVRRYHYLIEQLTLENRWAFHWVNAMINAPTIQTTQAFKQELRTKYAMYLSGVNHFIRDRGNQAMSNKLHVMKERIAEL